MVKLALFTERGDLLGEVDLTQEALKALHGCIDVGYDGICGPDDGFSADAVEQVGQVMAAVRVASERG